MNDTATISIKSLWTLISSMSINDRRWIADRLNKQITKEDKKQQRFLKELSNPVKTESDFKSYYADKFAQFSADWGGEEDADTVAKNLRDGIAEARNVDKNRKLEKVTYASTLRR